MALFCRTDRLHGEAYLLTKEEQMSLQEASISVLTREAGTRVRGATFSHGVGAVIDNAQLVGRIF